jgi:hypothetical protein
MNAGFGRRIAGRAAISRFLSDASQKARSDPAPDKLSCAFGASGLLNKRRDVIEVTIAS